MFFFLSVALAAMEDRLRELIERELDTGDVDVDTYVNLCERLESAGNDWRWFGGFYADSVFDDDELL